MHPTDKLEIHELLARTTYGLDQRDDGRGIPGPGRKNRWNLADKGAPPGARRAVLVAWNSHQTPYKTPQAQAAECFGDG